MNEEIKKRFWKKCNFFKDIATSIILDNLSYIKSNKYLCHFYVIQLFLT